MAQQNEHNHSFDPATVPVKRKRGRPRKEDVPGTEPSGRTQRRRRNPPPTTGPGLVGQPVSGILDGVFDAGFLITVRVGNNGPLLRGVVFDSRLSVPISAANDVAPHIKMSKREEIPIPAPIPAEPLQKRGPNLPSPFANKGGPKVGSQGSALKAKVSEAVISRAHSAIAKEATPVTVQVPYNQRQVLTGESKLDSRELKLGSTSQTTSGNEAAGEPKVDPKSKAYQGNETAGKLKLGSTSQTTVGNEAAGEPNLEPTSKASQGNETAGKPKLDCVKQTTSVNEATGELKVDCVKQTTPGNEAAGEPMVVCVSQTTLGNEAVGAPKVDCVSQTPMDNETTSVLKQCSTDQTPPVNETASEQKLGSKCQKPLVNETVKEPMLESTSQISLEPHGPAPVSEPDSKNAEIQNDADQVKSRSSAAGTQPLTSQASSEVLQETKANPNW